MDIRAIDECTPEYKLYIPEEDWRDYQVESQPELYMKQHI